MKVVHHTKYVHESSIYAINFVDSSSVLNQFFGQLFIYVNGYLLESKRLCVFLQASVILVAGTLYRVKTIFDDGNPLIFCNNCYVDIDILSSA